MYLFLVDPEDIIVNFHNEITNKKGREILILDEMMNKETAIKVFLERADIKQDFDQYRILFTAEKTRYDLSLSYDVFRSKFIKVVDVYIKPSVTEQIIPNSTNSSMTLDANSTITQ